MSSHPKPVFHHYEKIMILVGLGLLVFFLGYGLGRSTSRLDEAELVYAEVVGGDPKSVGKKIYGRDVLAEIEPNLMQLEREKYRLKRAATEQKLVEILGLATNAPSQAAGSETQSSDTEEIAEFARQRGIDLRKLTDQQLRDLKGKYLVFKNQLARREKVKDSLESGAIKWGIVPSYHRPPSEVAAGILTPLSVGSGEHRVVVFANYHCPTCQSLWPKLDELLKRAGGKVSLHLRFYLQEGDAAVVRQTALAGYCLDEQKKLAEFHQAMRDQAPMDEDELLGRIFAIPGVAKAPFENCLKARMTEQKLERDVRDGKSLGFSEQAISVVNGVSLAAQDSLAEYLVLIRQ
jgi:hypothetical protein